MVKECIYELSIGVCAYICFSPFNSFLHSLMGSVSSTKDKLLQERRQKECAYMRLEFTEPTCALLFECLGDPTHSRRRGMLPECNYRSRVECSSFGSRFICHRVRLLPARRSNAHDWCSRHLLGHPIIASTLEPFSQTSQAWAEDSK